MTDGPPFVGTRTLNVKCFDGYTAGAGGGVVLLKAVTLVSEIRLRLLKSSTNLRKNQPMRSGLIGRMLPALAGRHDLLLQQPFLVYSSWN